MVLECTVILAFHSNFQPYLIQRINTTETLYLLCLSSLAILQLLKKKNIQTIISAILLILLVLHTTILAVYKGFRFFRKRFGFQRCLLSNKPFIKYGSLHRSLRTQPKDQEIKNRSDVFEAIFGNANEVSLSDEVKTPEYR